MSENTPQVATIEVGDTFRVRRVGNKNRTTFTVEKVIRRFTTNDPYPAIVFMGKIKGRRTHSHLVSANELATGEML